MLRDGQPAPIEVDPTVIRRGVHVPVYVKDVFPNSGRFSVTLDPNIDKKKVITARRQKREFNKNRTKVKKLEGVDEEGGKGTEKKAEVVKLLRAGILLDVGLPVPAFLPHASIPDSIKLEEVRRIGVLATVRIRKTEKQLKAELVALLPAATPSGDGGEE